LVADLFTRDREIGSRAPVELAEFANLFAGETV